MGGEFTNPNHNGIPFYGVDNSHTVDGQNPAPLQKPWNDDYLVNTSKLWFPMVSKWCRISSIHSSELNSLKPAQDGGLQEAEADAPSSI